MGGKVQPLAQVILDFVHRTYRPVGYEATESGVLVSSLRGRGLTSTFTVAALAEGFGPGWTAGEVSQLALQALRNHMVGHEGGDLAILLREGLQAANRAVYDRAHSYDAAGDIGVEMVVAIVHGDRAVAARVRGGVYVSRTGADLAPMPSTLEAGNEGFLGQSPELELWEADQDGAAHEWADGSPGFRLDTGDRLVIGNGPLARSLAKGMDTGAVGSLSLDRAADRFLKVAQSAGGDEELSLLLVEMPGAAKKAAALVPRNVRLAMMGVAALAVIALLIWGTAGLVRSLRGPETTPTPSTTPTATIDLPPPPTDLPMLPTPVRTATRTPTPTGTSTPTPTPTSTATATPSPTATPTATETPAASPTIPVGPIVVGGQIVIVATEGLGVSLRAGPGSLYDRLFIVEDGDLLQVISGPEEVDGSVWWQLRTADGREGWAVDQFLQGVGSP